MDKQLVELEWLILRAGANELTPGYVKRRALAALRLLIVAPSVLARSGARREELGLLDQARMALRRDDVAQALSAIDEYLARFPHGEFLEEVAVIRAQASGASRREEE